MTLPIMRLKTCVAILCLFFIYLPFSAVANDPIRIVVTNWTNSMGHPGDEMCVILAPDNTLHVNIHVRMADNNLSSYPDMYLEYDWGGYLGGVTDQIVSSDLVSDTIGGCNLFVASFFFIVQLSQECEFQSPTEPFRFDFSYALVSYDYDSDAYVPYPINTISALFPPAIFPEVTEFGFDFSYNDSKDVCCSDGSLSGGRSQDDDIQNVFTSKTFEDLSTSPNPFRDEIEVFFKLNEPGELEIKIFDAQGNQVSSEQELNLEPGYINRHYHYGHLPDGVYYLQISSNSFSQFVKIAKFSR